MLDTFTTASIIFGPTGQATQRHDRKAGFQHLGGDNISRALAFTALSAVALTLLAVSVGGFDHDENQYILGAYFAQHNKIYKDFLYLQPPFHAVFMGQLFKLFGDHGYFVIARMMTFAFGFGCALLFYSTALAVTKSRAVAIVLTLLLVATPTFSAVVSVARNDAMPLFFSLLAIRIIIATPAAPQWRFAFYSFAGLCVAIAVGTKLNYAHMAIACMIISLFWPATIATSERLQSQTIPMVLGGAVGLLVIVHFAYYDFEAFLYGVFEHHSNPPPAYIASISDRFSHGRTLEVAYSQLEHHSIAGALVLLICATVLHLLYKFTKEPKLHCVPNTQWMFWLIFFAGVPLALLPTPNHPWYYAPIVPFFFLGVASLWAYPSVISWPGAKLLFFCIGIGASLPNLTQTTHDRTARLLDRAHWTPLRVSDASRRVDRLLADARVAGKIATLSPALLIESKHSFYLQLSTGPFFYRRTPYLPAERIERLHGASPSSISRIFANDMPAAIFGGHEASLDEPLFQFAQVHGYRRIEDRVVGGTLYLRDPTAVLEAKN